MNFKIVSTFHVIIYTEQLKPIITAPGDKILYKTIWKILENKNSQLYRINGHIDHMHLLIEVPPIIPISSIIKDILTGSALLIHESRIFPEFEDWSPEVLIFSTSYKDRKKLTEYIRDQELFHKKYTTKQEKKLLLKSYEIA